MTISLLKRSRTDVVEEYLDWRGDEDDFTEYSQVYEKDDGHDRMDEEPVEPLHVEDLS